MKAVLASVVIAIICLSLPASAAPPDFSVCDELQGAAAGLCRAAVAVGCAEDSSTNACSMIAEQYERITGSSPPFFGARISPTSTYVGDCYQIIDPQGRLELSDLVYFHLPSTDPTSGIAASIYTDLSQPPDTLGGAVPRGLEPGGYQVSVLTASLELKIGPFDFVVTDVTGGVVCGR